MDTTHEYVGAEQYLMERAKQKNIPMDGSLELLPLCNMNCDMCYVRLSRQEMEKQGRIRSGAEWLALGREMAKAGTLFLLLTGGEPLLHPDFKEIYTGLKKMGFILTINTNGTLITEEWADFFAKNKPRRINITLYGADEEAYENLCHYKGGFEKVIRAVELLRQRNVDVKLAGSMATKNADDFSRMMGIAKELDVPLHIDPYMMPAARERSKPFDEQSRLQPEAAAAACVSYVKGYLSKEGFAQYRDKRLEQIDTFVPGEEVSCAPGCAAGRCSFTINWQGQMRPCVVATEPTADVFELGFEESWKTVSSQFQQIRFCSKCSNCRLRPVCRTCALACLTETGNYMGRPDYLCRYAAETERLLRLSLEEETHE